MEKELANLRARVEQLERELLIARSSATPAPILESAELSTPDLPLPLADYRRYGRQMILEGFGLPGQLKLKNASVLVVGAGGLGCPALQHLAAAGVGSIGIVDHDTVELSNLQRQILHTDTRIGWAKALSAKAALSEINPSVKVTAYVTSLDSTNARALLSQYALVLDCTDNPQARYLLSDMCSELRVPLVSGAAMRYDGQLCTYNLGEDGPCYRCLFPRPPKPETVGTCEDVGVLGVVTGVIGTLQAMEAIKIIVGMNNSRPSLLVFSALSTPPFRTVRIRGKRIDCAACGSEVHRRDKIEETDYVSFCGGNLPDWEQTGLVAGQARISPQDLNETIATFGTISVPFKLIDVRSSAEFGICHLPSSENIPLKTLLKDPARHVPLDPSTPTFVVCRLGNDSQIAVEALRKVAPSGDAVIRDLVGGLRAWSSVVDSSFPVY